MIYTVYLLKLKNDVVYVGCTNNLQLRVNHHSDKKYDSMDTLKFDTRQEALDVERRLIVIFMPKYNHIPKHMHSNRVNYIIYQYK